jgi:hypothetical protein
MGDAMNRCFRFAACALGAGLLAAGERPYELVWANRTEDDHPALVPFTSVEGWRVETADAEARLERSQEVLLFGDAVAKLTYRAAGPSPRVTLVPPEPVAVTGAFDAVTCWIYGNNHSYAPDPKTPPVTVALRFADAAGQPFSVQLARVHFKEWFLCHRRLEPGQTARVAGGAKLLGIEIAGGRNAEERAIYLNSLAVFTETFTPLEFASRRQRGARVFPACDPGANTGPGALPFPDTPLTIVPRDSAPSVARVAKGESGRFYLVRDGEDGRLEVRLPAKLGAWDDLELRWNDGGWAQVALGGGLYFAAPGATGTLSRAASETAEVATDGKSVTCAGRLTAPDGRVSDARVRYQLVGKSLVMDIQADGGEIGEVRFGATRGFAQPRPVTFPYYTYGYSDGLARPAVIVSGAADAPLFYLANIDWTQSNASAPFAENLRFDGSLASNGGTRYHPKTDGRRNPCFERFVLTLSPRVEEVLPHVPNPPSPWKHITGARVWRAHGASDRARDTEYWRTVRRWGMTEVVVTDHETGWRDGNESFTFRTAPAPKKGGDEGQFRYARAMQDELGFVYGPYNNFTDFAPVNGFWHIDLIARTRENQLQHAWERCYAPKPARAVEFCERLAPAIEKKFGFSTAYCDVHTAVTPWSRVDYDARVPGAGTFAAVFYAYGEIMLLQKEAWGGPVYSEGNNHFPYCGLTDGNYAQDQNYRIGENPWLVDFDLRRLHDLCCNFGMGNEEMFYPGKSAPADRDAAADRFLAATVAFGHPGFLMHGRDRELRSYYMIQALAALYTQVSADTIRYADAGGALHDTSAALANGAYARSQIVTRYADGTVTAVNGNPEERFRLAMPNPPEGGTTNGARAGFVVPASAGDGQAWLDLPPNGYWGRSADGSVRVFSGEVNGRRADLSVSPAYTYIDGRGAFVRFPEGASAGAAVCRPLANGFVEILLHKTDEAGFPGTFMDAVALDAAGAAVGPAEVRSARGLSYILPVKGAFSYRARRLERAPPAALACERDTVRPGERVVVRGSAEHAVFIPSDAKPGERLWVAHEGAWLDFTVEPRPEVAGHLVAPDLRAGMARPPAWPAWYARGMALRGGPERELDAGTGAQLYAASSTCGGVTKPRGLFMHPPYKGGTGYVFARYALTLPREPLAFRCAVGKQDGSDAGDGLLFKVLVEDAAGARAEIANRHVAAHAWYALEGSLAPWAGQAVNLLLVTDVGEKNDSSGDWGAWAELRLEWQ